MKKLIISFLILQFQLTNANLIVCDERVDYSLPAIRLGNSSLKSDGFWSNLAITNSTCFDEKTFKSDDAFMKSYTSLKNSGALDENNCIAERELTNEEAKLMTEVTLKTLDQPLKVFALSDSKNGEVKKIVVTNSTDSEFAKHALTNKDKIELAGITLLSSGIGVLIERRAFKGQHDKLLHANWGAVINIGSNLASYVLVEELGLGNKLKLSREQKKVAILLTGTAMGALIGYGKERFYDYYRRKTHTYDPNFKGDMGATMLGGGALTPLLITYKVTW
jgi:hypothetical protein